MGLFKKEKGVEVLDLTLLQKRGLLKLPHSPPLPQFLAPPSSPVSDSNPFSMLDALAGSASSSPSSSSSLPSSVDAHELNALKIKLEDVEYKLERLAEKLAKLDALLGQK